MRRPRRSSCSRSAAKSREWRGQRSARQQAARVGLAVLGDPGIDLGGEADHVRRHIVDQHGAVDAGGVQIVQESARRTDDAKGLIEIRPGVAHDRQRGGLEHLERGDVDVAIGNQHFFDDLS
jgi:hypothetical protein